MYYSIHEEVCTIVINLSTFLCRSPLWQVFTLVFDKAGYTIGMHDEVYDRSKICATFVDVQKIHPVPLLSIND